MSAGGERPEWPGRRHLPGTGTRPDRAWLAAACEPPRRARLLALGARLCAGGYYWEAHEVWERAWALSAPNARERLLLVALIQFANALLKRDLGRPAASRRLLGLCASALGECLARSRAARPRPLGVDLRALHRALAALARPPERGGEANFLGRLPGGRRPGPSSGNKLHN